MFEKCIIGSVGIVKMQMGKNMISQAFACELKQLIKEYSEMSNICSIVLTGNERYFSVGADLKEGMEKLREIDLQSLKNTSKPLIAAVDGFALGGGFELALACDMIYASERSIFGFPETKLGIIPEWGGAEMLLQTIGRQKTMEIILRARYLPAREAYRLGIVNAIVERNFLVQKVVEIANEMRSPSIPEAKKSILRALKGKEMKRK